MATRPKRHADEEEAEHKDFSDATLRHYYGDVTPYGTLQKRDGTGVEDRQDSIAPLTTQTQQSTLRRPSSGRGNSATGTLRSVGSSGATLRRSKGGFYTRSPEPDTLPHNIGYKDFLPKKRKEGFRVSKRYHGFSSCVEEGNSFLEQNPGIRVKSCESLYVRLDHDHNVNPESTTTHDRSYVIGLRIWYMVEDGDDSVFVRSSATEPKQCEDRGDDEEKSTEATRQTSQDAPKLCYMNVIPQCVNSSGNKTIASRHRQKPSFETLNETLKRLNEELSTRPIQGQVFNVETIPINYYHAFRDEKELDPDYGYWCLDYHGDWNFFIIRIFYLEGTPTQNACDIGFKDFAPGSSDIVEKCPGIHTLTQRASQWLSAQEDIKLLGSQAIELSFQPKKLDRRKKVDTACSTSTFSKVSASTHTIRFLRLWYMGLKSQLASSSPSQKRTAIDLATKRLETPGIAVRNFFPCQITTQGCCGLRRPIFATTEDTIDRIKDWISMTNAEVICIQTDCVEKWKGRECQVGDSLATRLYNKQDFCRSTAANVLEYRLTVFRVFIRADAEGVFLEPDTSTLLRCPTPMEPCCCFVGCSIM